MLTPLKTEVEKVGDLAHEARRFRTILWSFEKNIELLFKGRTIRSGGHGFVGIGRKKLLNILQRRCEALGVERPEFEPRATEYGPPILARIEKLVANG